MSETFYNKIELFLKVNKTESSIKITFENCTLLLKEQYLLIKSDDNGENNDTISSLYKIFNLNEIIGFKTYKQC